MNFDDLKEQLTNDGYEFESEVGEWFHRIVLKKKNVAKIEIGIHSTTDNLNVYLSRKTEYGGYSDMYLSDDGSIVPRNEMWIGDQYQNVEKRMKEFSSYDDIKSLIDSEFSRPPVKKTKSRPKDERKSLIQNIFGTMMKEGGARIVSYANNDDKHVCKVSMERLSIMITEDNIWITANTNFKFDLNNPDFDPHKMVDKVIKFNEKMSNGEI